MDENEITEQDTYDCFIGSGALPYPWYAEVDGDWGNWKHTGENHWKITFVDGIKPVEDGETPERLILNHQKILTVVRDLAIKHINGYVPPSGLEHFHPHEETRRQCLLFLGDPDHASFDAGLADEVMQIAAFGKVIYD